MTKKTVDQPVVSPLLDAAGNPSLVSAGQLIESAWGNSVAGRVVNRYPSFTALNAVAAPTGTLAITTDTNVIFLRDGATWKPTTMGHVITFRAVGGTPQQIPKNVITGAQWPVEENDPYGVHAAGTFTVPPGWGGRWRFDWAVEYTVGGMAGWRMTFLGTGAGARLGQFNDGAWETGNFHSGSASVVLAAGGTAFIGMYHTDTVATLPCNTSNKSYFQGVYVGID